MPKQPADNPVLLMVSVVSIAAKFVHDTRVFSSILKDVHDFIMHCLFVNLAKGIWRLYGWIVPELRYESLAFGRNTTPAVYSLALEDFSNHFLPPRY